MCSRQRHGARAHRRLGRMRLAHVQERNAPAGTAWRLAAALDPAATTWLDLEVARRRAVTAQPNLAHDSALHRVNAHDARRPPRPRAARGGAGRPRRGIRAARRRRRRGPRRRRPRVRPAGPAATVVPRLLRLRAARRGRCGSGAARRSPRRGSGCRSSTSRTRPSCAGRASRCGPRAGSAELDYELEIGALIDTPAVRPRRRTAAEEAIGGYFDPQRLVRPGPPARRVGGQAGAGEGQGLRGVDRALARDAGRARRQAGDGRERAGPGDDGDRPDGRRPGGRDVARDVGLDPPRVRGDGRPGVGGRAPATRGHPRQRDRRRRLPARDPGGTLAATWSPATRSRSRSSGSGAS